MKRVTDKGPRCTATSISISAPGRCVCGRGAEVQGQSRQIQDVRFHVKQTVERPSRPVYLECSQLVSGNSIETHPWEKPLAALVGPRQQPEHANTAAVAGKDQHSLGPASKTSRKKTVEGNPPRTDMPPACQPFSSALSNNEGAITPGRGDFVLPLLKDGEASPKK